MVSSKERRRRKERRRGPAALKRRKSKLVPITLFVLLCLGLAWFFESQSTTTIIFVRHADIDAAFRDDDPPLSNLGHRRAELLADALEEIDVVAGVDAIYVADSRRTQQTAAPLARRLELEPRIADPYQVEQFMAEVLREHNGEIVLVATHADILAPLVEELHGSKNIPPMDGDNNFDNIYIVTIPWFGKVKTLRLHYGLLLPPPGHGVFSDTL